MNVYLDVARLLGEPFTWAKFDARLLLERAAPVPHPKNPLVDSLRLIGFLRNGRFPDGRSVTVWTSTHILLAVAMKAAMPKTAEDPRDEGLGWSEESAQALIEDLVWGTVLISGGDTVGDIEVAYGNPPLDYEDGLVYASARAMSPDDAYCDRVCITRDRQFLASDLPGDIRRCRPWNWLEEHQAAARKTAMRNLLGSTPPPNVS